MFKKKKAHKNLKYLTQISTHKKQLTECEGDVITHAQKLSETYWASIFVYPQLCNPAGDEELAHHSNDVIKTHHMMNAW